MTADTISKPLNATAIAPVVIAVKQVPVVAVAAAFAALGAAQDRPAPSPFVADRVTISALPRVLNGTIFRYGQDGAHYGVSGYFNGAYIGLDIERSGDDYSPISVAGTVGQPINLTLKPNPETFTYTAKGQANGKDVNLGILTQLGNEPGLLVSGTVGTSFATFELTGKAIPDAHYTLLGRGGGSTVNMNIDETGSDGSAFTVTGTIN